jgi:hypothetical protein
MDLPMAGERPVNDLVARSQRLWTERFAALDAVLEDLDEEQGDVGEAVRPSSRFRRTGRSSLVQHSGQEHRDVHIGSGMEGGMQEAFDRLENVARSLA